MTSKTIRLRRAWTEWGAPMVLFKTEKDREVRREIVRYLSMMDSEEAQQFMSKIFEG